MLADLIDWSKLDTVEVDAACNECEGCVFDSSYVVCSLAGLTDRCMGEGSSYVFILKKEQPAGGVKGEIVAPRYERVLQDRTKDCTGCAFDNGGLDCARPDGFADCLDGGKNSIFIKKEQP